MLLLSKYKPEVMCVTESQIDASVYDGKVEVPLYTVQRCDRDLKKSGKKGGGGVLLYVREDVKCEVVSKVAGKDFEMIAIDLRASGERIVGLYRRPGNTLSGELAEALVEVLATNKSVILLGDLNMDTREETPLPKRLMLLLSKQFKLYQKVKFVTRRKGNGGTTIDHIWTKQQCVCGKLPEMGNLSDHEVIGGWCRNTTAAGRHVQKIKRRKWKSAPDKEMVGIIKERIGAVNKGNIGNSAKMETLVEAWDEAWKEIKKRYAPIVEVKIKAGIKRRQWMTKELSGKVKKRNGLRKRACRVGATPEDKHAFRQMERLSLIHI